MRMWRNAKIRTKVGASLLVATLGLSWFAVRHVTEVRTEANDAGRVQTLATALVKVGDLLHESQRERGRTAQFLGSGGKSFSAELQAQRKATDAKVADLKTYVAHVGDQLGFAGSELAASDTLGTTLHGLRAKADQLGDPKEVIGGYTTLDNQLLDLTAHLVAQKTDPELGRRMQAYVAFANAKEKTGLERAQLSNVFGTDSFGAGQLAVIAGLIAGQTAYLNVFSKLAPPALLHAYETQMNTPAVMDVHRMEQIALSRASGFGIDSAVWFGTMTKKIELMKGIEDLLAGAVRGGAQSIRDGAKTSLIAAVALAILMIGAALGGTLALSVSILRPLGRLRQAVDRITEGDSTVTIVLGGPVEIRELADAFRRMAESLRWSRSAVRQPQSATRSVGSRLNLRP